MKTIKIYKVTCTCAYMMGEQGSNFSLDAWGDDTDQYQGYDDGGKNYIVPSGLDVSTSQYGNVIFNEDTPCDIFSHYGRPAVVADGKLKVFKIAV